MEPDTQKVGPVKGTIEIIDAKGVAQREVPVKGLIKPYLKLSPSRLFLGAVEYGTTSGKLIEKRLRLSADRAWDLERVDLSEIPGAKCEIRDLKEHIKEAHLTFPEDVLKAKQAFGAFVEKTVRFHTNLPKQPEVAVSITAVLSQNGTAREFKKFIYKGTERWSGPWGTPNIAASILAPLTLLVGGYGILLLRPSRARILALRCLGIVLLCAALCGCVLIAFTYSRGGWLAFGTGLAAMFLIMKDGRHGIAALALTFGLILCGLPAGVERLASATAVVEDASVHNRLLVWRGALEMIADHPLSGIGTGEFARVFSGFYQAPWHKQSYSTAINDYLTLAAERGLPLFLALLALTAFVMIAALLWIQRAGSSGLVPVWCAQIAILTASAFSGVAAVTEVRMLFYSGAGLLCVYCAVVAVSRHKNHDSYPKREWLEISSRAGTGVGLLVVLACGFVITAQWRRSVVLASPIGGGGLGSSWRSLDYRPNMRRPRGTVLFVTETGQSLPYVGKMLLRSFAKNGWRATAVRLSPFDQEAAQTLSNIAHAIDGPLIVVAANTKARVALALADALNSRELLTIGLAAPLISSKLPECDRSDSNERNKARIRVIDALLWDECNDGVRGSPERLIQVLEGKAENALGPRANSAEIHGAGSSLRTNSEYNALITPMCSDAAPAFGYAGTCKLNPHRSSTIADHKIRNSENRKPKV